MNVTVVARFAHELMGAMKRRDITVENLARAVHVSERHVTWWRMGKSLPRLAMAARLADALDAPMLVEITRQARTFRCVVCGMAGTSEGTGTSRKYCSEGCRKIGRIRGTKPLPTTVDNRLRLLSAAVSDFCFACQPEGLCFDGACPLRAVSPLPLAAGVVAVPRPVDGRKSRWDDPGARARASQLMKAKHYKTPELRQRISEWNRKRWAEMTPERRAEMSRLISAGIRRNAA